MVVADIPLWSVPRYSSSLEKSEWHEPAGPLSNGSFSVCVCECVMCVDECVCSVKRSMAGLYIVMLPPHTHLYSLSLPLGMTGYDGLAVFSWLLYIVNIFKRFPMGRAGVRFRPIAESRSRWRGVRRRDRGWACRNTSAIHEESREGGASSN